MHKTILQIMSVLLIIFSVSCSKVEDTPSAVVLQYFDSLEKGDLMTLKKVMTKESYHLLLKEYLQNISNDSKVFRYDTENFQSDSESLKRVEKEVSDYLKKKREKNSINLLSEKGVTQKERIIHLEKNGQKREYSLILSDSGKWLLKGNLLQ